MTPLVHTLAALVFIAATSAGPSKPVAPADLDSPPANATRTPEGLIWYTLSPGTGDQKPSPDGYVKLRYAIFRENGTLIDWVPSDRASIVAVDRMMPGWRDVVIGMTAGERRRAWLPPEVGGGKIPEGQTYIIDTELVGLVEGPKTPIDLTAAPADATRTKSGLASVILRPGTGTEHPKRRSKVVVHYSGWTTEGRLFDSSVLRGEPAEFRVDEVIAGWTEGLQLMVEGEARRFWIPAKLAYEKDPSKPQGMLVFDIELVDVK